ncbi:MAG TPA: outer membrane beta-barrel protein, partial [Chitinophagales bacterium]|nr:outer membrane beta-barrel protein [Chitinophagales bacterium]
RSTLRSFVEPAKLEYLAIEDNAIGTDNLSPSMDKMLKNLKQFSGYDINKGIHFGAFILINNVWLSNKKHSMDENTQSIRPMITFGKAYGINIGYDFSDRWGTQIEWQIAEQGQRYKVKQADQYHTKEINLLYTKFPIVAKYKQTFNNNYNAKPIALSFIFGPQLGVLIKQKYSLAGEPITSMASYSKVEFGMLVGFDFDLFMTRNVAMTIGARSGFMAPTQRNKPMSFQLGITSQFNFRFPKKIK